MKPSAPRTKHALAGPVFPAIPAPPVVVMAGSAGALPVFQRVISALPPDFPAAVAIVQHLPPSSQYQSVLRELLSVRSRLPVKWIENDEPVQGGIVYLAPQDSQARVTADCRFELTPLIRRRCVRPAADPLFASAAAHFGERAVGIVLTGSLSDGASGAHQIADAGGRVFVQDERSAFVFDMPKAAIRKGAVDFVLPPHEMAHALVAFLMAPGADAWFRVGTRDPMARFGLGRN